MHVNHAMFLGPHKFYGVLIESLCNMKKRNFKTLRLHKVVVSTMLLGGLSASGSEQTPEALDSSDDLTCGPISALPDTMCTCA